MIYGHHATEPGMAAEPPPEAAGPQYRGGWGIEDGYYLPGVSIEVACPSSDFKSISATQT